MYYPVLISLALVAPVFSQSSSIRKLQKAYFPKYDVTRDCNNVAEDLQDALTSQELKTIQLDETGVYFVPAAVRLLRTHFTDESFVILNPVNFVKKNKISRTKKEYTPKIVFRGETTEKVKTFIQNEEGNVKKTRKTPSYFDVDVQETTDNDRAAIGQNNLIEDFESTERALVECLDLQILDYTRKYGAADEFRDFWEARNLKSYEGLLNSDLHDRIRKYCSQPEFIIEQSLLDIKRGVPKKEKDMTSVPDNVDNNRSKLQANEHLHHSMARSSDDESFTSWSESTPIYDDATEIATTINNSIEDMIMNTTDNNMSNETNNTVTTPLAIPKERSIQNAEDLGDNFNRTEEAVSGITAITTESSLDSVKHLSADRQELNTDEDKIGMDTMASEVMLTTHNYNITEPISYELTTLTPSKPQESLSFKINDEYDVSIYDISTTPVTTVYPQSRITYKENEIKIPKLTTRECENNTVQSKMDGSEVIPNNDFENLDRSGNNNRGPGLESLIESSTERDVNVSLADDDYIAGNLYFGFSKELVPVRFQPTNSGKINLGIDGDSLCEKLLQKTNDKSLLLTTLCNCVQKKMLQNNSTKT